MVRTMAKDPIIFACANPTPEIFPDEAKAAGAAVVSTGRSDYPNQVNNVLCFPGIFRGALDVRASDINDEMKVAAAAAIAALILIFAVTVAAINLANAWSLRGQISQSLQMLTGSYIPPSEREKVFDRFYRAESAAQTQGSGIGLAIARSIAALHHGDIFLESNEASGTAFIVTLPEDAK